ncbi:MAG: hypothetical protein JNM72_01595 [Deltaproteobacteria bacterium]|nr:hypothetical protein [Deltaproteobacteria bacterium]
MWIPPPPAPDDEAALRGTLGGARLFEQPAHRAKVDALLAFLDAPGPVCLEVGVDYGGRLLSQAAAQPGVRWIGLEIKKPRVAELSAKAPANCLVWAADARVLLARVLPPGRLSRVEVFFPTPTFERAHLLWSPAFVAALGRALAPGGLVWSRTDVEGLHHYVGALLAGWAPAESPPEAPVPSRRERVCAREGLPVFTLCRRRPMGALEPAVG